MNGLKGWIEGLNAKRAVGLAVGPALAMFGLDAAIAHLAGREMVVPAQYIPVVFAPVAAVTLMAGAAPKLNRKVLARIFQVVGGAAAAVGLLGTGFHVRALMRLLEGGPLTFANLTAALACAPPLMAPGGFAAIGLALIALANPRVTLRMEPGTPNAPTAHGLGGRLQTA